MSHLDEGTLHALLDGELDLHEVREIQAHLGSCSACGTRLQSVKEVLAESDRLVGAIQFPGTPRRPAALEPEIGTEPEFEPEPADEPAVPPPAPGADAGSQPRVSPRRPPARLPSQPVYDEPPPVLLVPEDSQWGERRRRLLTGMRWAALALVAVGAGYIANEVRRTSGVPRVATESRPAEETDTPAGAVVSPEETARPDSIPAVAALPDRAANESLRKESVPVRQVAPPPEAAEPEPESAPEPEPTPPAAKLADEDQEPAVDETPQAPAPEDVRSEAAEALAEIDRQRRAERAAAATASLDAERRRQLARNAAAAEPAAPPPPAPRTLEQRSGIYLRIGLDEAARQLGRPVHVIEGMQPQFMGLAQGSGSQGADPTRPVVRVVYQDNQGRMILLDQQRIRPGQNWGSGDTRWITGEIGLSLRGEPGPEVLRNLRPRVR